MKAMLDTPVTVVVPCYNEAPIITEVMAELEAALKVGFAHWEILVVDDGSSDGTAEILQDLSRHTPQLKVERLHHNRGQTEAMFHGFARAKHATIVAMDSDGQNDPRDIERLVRALNTAGAACVSGWRKNRKDQFLRVAYSKVANRLISRYSQLNLHDFGCTLKAYRRDALSELEVNPDLHRVIPAYIHANGGRVTELEVNHRPRLGGLSKYGYGRVVAVLQDLVLIYTTVRHRASPLRLLGGLGLAFLASALVVLFGAVVLRLLGYLDFVESPLLLFSGILAVTGIQLLTSGVVFQLLAAQIEKIRSI